MTKLRFLFIIAAMLGSTGTACNRKSDQQEAVEAQQKANAEIQDTRREAQQDNAEIRKDVADKTAEARKDYDQAVADGRKKLDENAVDARETEAKAQADANKQIRAANADRRKHGTALQRYGQEKIDSLNEDIDSARDKAQENSKGAARSDLESNLQAVEVKRDEIAHEIDTSTVKGSKKVEVEKDSVDKRVDKLKDRVDQLSKQL